LIVSQKRLQPIATSLPFLWLGPELASLPTPCGSAIIPFAKLEEMLSCPRFCGGFLDDNKFGESGHKEGSRFLEFFVAYFRERLDDALTSFRVILFGCCSAIF
jgi:hypothetical protein